MESVGPTKLVQPAATAVERAPTDALSFDALKTSKAMPFLGVLVVFYVWVLAQTSIFDLEIFVEAGRDVLAGRSPYPPLTAEALASKRSFVYPAPAALAMALLALLPYPLVVTLYLTAMVAALWGALRLLGASWGCFAAALASLPMFTSLVNGAFGPFLLFGLALAWRYRERALLTGAVVAALVLAKLFLWPLLLWLAFTRRLSALAVACGVAAGLSLVSWAIIGFDTLYDYPRVLSLLTEELHSISYSPSALALAAGLSATSAQVVAVLVGGALAMLALLYRRDERLLFATLLVVSLVVSPIVWAHYFVVLFAPLALYRPRFGVAWLAPLAFWAALSSDSGGIPWVIALPWLLIAAVVMVWRRPAPVVATG